MRAEKEMGMQMQTAMEMEMGEGRKGRGFIGREVRRVPPLPSLPFFFVIYIMCGEANRDKLPKDGGGGRESDHWMDHLVLVRKHSVCY